MLRGERVREWIGWADPAALWRDLRFAVRHYARMPIAAAVISGTLAVGIGANSALFTVVIGTTLRPPPGVPDDPSLVMIRGSGNYDGQHRAREFGPDELMVYQSLRSAFTTVGGWAVSRVAVDAADQVEAASALFVTPRYFAVLGRPLAAGAGLVDRPAGTTNGPDLTAVIDYDWAVARFGNPGAAIGQPLKVNGVWLTIVGVGPPQFRGFWPEDGRVAWIPASVMPVVDRTGSDRQSSWRAVARLSNGVSLARASALVAPIGPRVFTDESQSTAEGWTTDVVRVRGNTTVMDASPAMIALNVATGLLGLIILLACTSTASALLVSSAATRGQEIGIRLAIGASRGRVIRQLLVESVLLALFGSVAGLVLMIFALRSAGALWFDVDVVPDWSTTTFALALAVGSAALCGLTPALHAARQSVSSVLQSSAAGVTTRGRPQRTIVASQLALAQPLLVSVLIVGSTVLRGLGEPDDPSVSSHIVEMSFAAETDAQATGGSISRVAERLATEPGVIAVARVSHDAPVSVTGDSSAARIPARVQSAGLFFVDRSYFRAVETRVMRGRPLVDADRSARPRPVVIGSDLAASIFGGADPIGQRLHQMTREGRRRADEDMVIVGVVDRKPLGLNEDGSPYRIVSLGNDEAFAGKLIIRTAGPGVAMLGRFRDASQAAAPLLAVFRINTLEARLHAAHTAAAQSWWLTAGAAALSLFLAAVGVYAIVALAVRQRHREIGVRMAIGARPAQIVWLFVRDTMPLAGIGLLVGTPLSLAIGWGIASAPELSGVTALMMASGTAMLLVGVVLGACWVPAWRASQRAPLVNISTQ